MAIQWTLKKYLAAKHHIYSVTELQKKIAKKTGVVISLAHLCKLVNETPKMVRLQTIEVIVSALECEVFDFLKVTPKKMNSDQKKKLSYKNTPKSKIGANSFPAPENYKE